MSYVEFGPRWVDIPLLTCFLHPRREINLYDYLTITIELRTPKCFNDT